MAEREESETCDEDCNERGIDNSERICDEVYNYLTDSQYPKQATRADKTTIRKRSKKFKVVDGVLHYKQLAKEGTVIQF